MASPRNPGSVGLPLRASPSSLSTKKTSKLLSGPLIAPTYVRKLLHIALSDFFYGACVAGSPFLDRVKITGEIEDLWAAAVAAGAGAGARAGAGRLPGPRPCVVLSVRTGLSLLLASLELPPGTEVYLSAATIHDVVRVVEHYDLVPVPIDVDVDTLAPRVDLLEYALSTRPAEQSGVQSVFIAAYVFGSRYALEPYLAVARRHNVLVVEDAAQAFTGMHHYTGSPAAHVSLFSFGSIKRATAFGGAIMGFGQSQELAEELGGVPDAVRARRDALPVRSRLTFANKLVKYFVLRYGVSHPTVLTFIARAAEAMGSSLDELITSVIRGFPGDGFFDQIHQQPSAPLLALLKRRLEAPSEPDASLAARMAVAEAVRAALPDTVVVPGSETPVHSYWLFPMMAHDPHTVIEGLKAIGVDATQGASQMDPVPVPDAIHPKRQAALVPIHARAILGDMVYIPISQELPLDVVEDIIRVVQLATADEPAYVLGTSGMYLQSKL